MLKPTIYLGPTTKLHDLVKSHADLWKPCAPAAEQRAPRASAAVELPGVGRLRRPSRPALVDSMG